MKQQFRVRPKRLALLADLTDWEPPGDASLTNLPQCWARNRSNLFHSFALWFRPQPYKASQFGSIVSLVYPWKVMRWRETMHVFLISFTIPAVAFQHLTTTGVSLPLTNCQRLSEQKDKFGGSPAVWPQKWAADSFGWHSAFRHRILE